MICCLLPFEVHVPCVCASACVLCVSVRTSASLILKITPPRTHGDLIFSSLSNVHVLNESTKRRRHSNTTPGFWRAAVGVGGRERHGGTGTGTAETGPRRADEQAKGRTAKGCGWRAAGTECCYGRAATGVANDRESTCPQGPG